MSRPSTAGFDLDRLAPDVGGGVRLLPMVHERVELASVGRAVLDTVDPAAVAVELPTTLREAAARAVKRLPRISLVISEEPGEEALVWVVAPGDPIVEAIRWAQDRNRPFFCIDPDLPYEERHADRVPDPYALWQMGAEAYLDSLQLGLERPEGSETDGRREAGMAFYLKQARDEVSGPIVAFIGAAHLRGVRSRLKGPLAHPFARTRRSRVLVRHLAPSSLTALLPDPPLAHAVWERVREGEAPSDTDLGSTLSRRQSVMRFGLRVIQGERGSHDSDRGEKLVEYASFQGTRAGLGGRLAPDRARLGGVVWRIASGSYTEQTGETVAAWQRRMFFDFSRRCARVQGNLIPGLYEWVIAARGVGDDNLAWEVFEVSRGYPWQEDQAEIETASVDGEELDLGTRKIRFRRRFFRVKRRPVAIPVRERPHPESPEDWLRAFDSSGVCSYPPEDLVVEDYGRFLQRKALSVLSAERKRTEPFSCSLLDGIDIRETLRNVHEDRVYVEEKGRVPGDAGSVAVIFDRDPDNDRYPFAMTWLGEHDQESDMAFYATNPADQVVGPGIMRATYGGFVLTQPRGRLFDVWSDADYSFAHGKAEVLLMAAIDYSLEKIVVHLALEAPAERLRRYAAGQGKQILHIPLASLSPLTLKKIRIMHILAGHDKRAIARDYVW
ncbi:MAG: hypothetical protein GWP16_00510 [Nitrospirae bacterium]|nr:hypothetical protein [Nitrospirota bacterium]